jgi:hypothetical protein
MFELPWLLMVIPPVTFLILSLYLGRFADVRLPLRFPVLLTIGTSLSFFWFAYSVRYSYGYHGPTYTVGITIINSAWILLLWALWYWIRIRARFWSALGWSLALNCWLFWFAFPWLGELP